MTQQSVELSCHSWLHGGRRVVGVTDAAAPAGEVVQAGLPEVLLPGQVVAAVLPGRLSLAVGGTVAPVTCIHILSHLSLTLTPADDVGEILVDSGEAPGSDVVQGSAAIKLYEC